MFDIFDFLIFSMPRRLFDTDYFVISFTLSPRLFFFFF